MNIEISKSDYKALVDLAEKCVAAIQAQQCTLREYNQARRLRLIIKKIQRNNKIEE